MRLAYADPPYPGCASLYKGHSDYAGEVDHEALIKRLESDFEGWVLHTSSVALSIVLPLIPAEVRVMAWVKSFAAFKRNVSVAYAWEPVIIKAARKPVVSHRLIMRDWIECPITLRKGLAGAKPENVCLWAFEMLGARPDDDLADLFPGTGAVAAAWKKWQGLFALPGRDATIRRDGSGPPTSPDAGRVPLPAPECAEVAHEGASGGTGAEPPIPAFDNSEAEHYFGVGNGCEPCASYRGERKRPDMECGYRHEQRAGAACVDFQART